MTSYPSRFLGVFAFAFVLGGCVSVEQLAPPVTSQMATRAGAPVPTLETGRRLYTGRCAACHSVDPVTKFSPDRWREIIGDMAHRAKLSGGEEASVLAYVLSAREATAAR